MRTYTHTIDMQCMYIHIYICNRYNLESPYCMSLHHSLPWPVTYPHPLLPSLQIDAHMRFAPEWDTRLIHMLRAAQNISHKPVLSTYPPGYTGLGQVAKFSTEPQPVLLCAPKFGQDKILRIDGRRLKAEPREPIRSRFWAAGYSFSRSEFINEVWGG